MSDKLKPCPFCGGEASPDGSVTFSGENDSAWWEDGTQINKAYFVNCINCGITNKNIVGGHQTKGKAIRHWNERRNLRAEKAESENEKLKAELIKVKARMDKLDANCCRLIRERRS